MTHLDKAVILKVNHLLEQHEHQFHQLEPVPPLYPNLHQDHTREFVGRWLDISDQIQARLEFIQSRRVLLEDLMFLLHDTVRMFSAYTEPEVLRNRCIKILDQNKRLIQQRIQDLTSMEQLYHSITIEPGVLSLPNGEQSDPSHLRIRILPPSSVSVQEARHLNIHWWDELVRQESLLSARLPLHYLPIA